jgi:hypothetical protein
MQDTSLPGELGVAELEVIWAILWAMVHNNHLPQDMMSEEEWQIAEALHQRLDTWMNVREP